MSLSTVQDIEQAIAALSPQELEELCGWLDQYLHPPEARIQSDAAMSRLDHMVQLAFGDEQNGSVEPL